MKEKNKEISNKKELRGLPLDFVKRFSGIGFKKGRKLLHDVYGVFKEKHYEKRQSLLEKIQGINDAEAHIKILRLHKSSKERLDYYQFIYEKIFLLTGKPKSIIDIGCGLNPLSLPFMGLDLEQLKSINYVALELTEDDAGFVQAYFDKIGINGTALCLNILNLGELQKACRRLGKIDICFMFKLLDTMETEKRGISKYLIEAVNAKWFAVSFSTRSLGGRKGISEKRLVWFEKLLKEGGQKVIHTFSIPNEKFYLFRKH